MDNTTILFTAIQRFYRNAIVTLIREQLTAQYAEAALTEVQRLFGKKDPETGNTYWEGIRAAANERRSGGTGELSTPIKDEFELLGVEHFYNVFETHFDTLCPSHGGKPKKEPLHQNLWATSGVGSFPSVCRSATSATLYDLNP